MVAKYHAGKHGAPLCGSRGTADRFNVVTLAPREWNALSADKRCAKCAEVIRKKKAAH